MEKVIEIQNLTKTYPLAKKLGRQGNKFLTAVNGISFSVEKGEIFGLLGPNGAGKTTTLEIIEGLKRQTSGKVAILGLDNIADAEEVKKRIGVQLQSSQYLHHLSLKELLDLFSSFYKQPKGAGTNSTSPLQVVNLEDKASEEFASLSGGQKQRFAIAVSLVNRPEILFLDEPTTGLDPAARRSLWGLIKKINAEGITIVLTTHYMEEAEFLCHHVAIMDQGKILEIDQPKKLIDRLSETTQVSFFTEGRITPELFTALPEVKKIHASYPKVILEISSLDKISAIVNLLKKEGIAFYGFMVKTATLEDVYLELTGKEYGEE
ncbi:MAG: ABC transporter ATP-binding protein [Patescibacteria group bacterium]|nr:ABC transporter ATP-binding protein [Patescibacteria group bacterium]